MGLSSRTSVEVTESSRIAAARLSVCLSVWQMSVRNRGKIPAERSGRVKLGEFYCI